MTKAPSCIAQFGAFNSGWFGRLRPESRLYHKMLCFCQVLTTTSRCRTQTRPKLLNLKIQGTTYGLSDDLGGHRRKLADKGEPSNLRT